MRIEDLSKIKFELSIGEVAKRSGVAVSALHFYEQKGLISSRRNNGNQRVYPRNVLRRIAVIKTAQTLGIPLAEIKEALDNLPQDSSATNLDWENLSRKWRKDLGKRIEKLMKLRDQLSHCIGCGCLSIKECRLRNPFDELGKNSSGAILLE
jgi:MerR family transcriptional regulator, redox-sensitive transcriptional activator SoxR